MHREGCLTTASVNCASSLRAGILNEGFEFPPQRVIVGGFRGGGPAPRRRWPRWSPSWPRPARWRPTISE
jgi:hypothetical protein